jgi:hypothetical protein
MPELTYRSAFERLWDEKSNIQISNGKSEHAAAILAVFFTRAQQRLNIFCRNLSRAVYDDPAVLSAFAGAVLRGIIIEIVVQERVEDGSAFLKLYQEFKRSKAAACVNLYQDIDKPVRDFDYNFAYVDDRAYRFEQNHNAPNAVVCAWGEKVVAALSAQFEVIKTYLTPQNEALDRQPA